MKILTVLLFILSLSVPARAGEIEMEVHGMACSFCAYGLEKKIKKLDGVESITIDVQTGKANVQTKEGTEIAPETLEKIAKDSGLELKNTVVKA